MKYVINDEEALPPPLEHKHVMLWNKSTSCGARSHTWIGGYINGQIHEYASMYISMGISPATCMDTMGICMDTEQALSLAAVLAQPPPRQEHITPNRQMQTQMTAEDSQQINTQTMPQLCDFVLFLKSSGGSSSRHRSFHRMQTDQCHSLRMHLHQ